MSGDCGDWGPSHQQLELHKHRRIWPWLLLGVLLLLGMAQTGGSLIDAALWLARPFGWIPEILAFSWLASWAAGSGHLEDAWRLLSGLRRHGDAESELVWPPAGEIVRARMLQRGGGAYLGQREHGSWITADPEHAVLVLGPPRSGKTSEVMIPAVLAAPGAVLSTATKPDVMAATWRARAEIGRVWLYDPAGGTIELPDGVRALHWSPVAAGETWDSALLTARAMAAAGPAGKGTTNEDHWRERASALLAPLLHAANLSGEPVASVLRWVLRQDLDRPAKILEDHNADAACDVLAGIARTEARERSSIFSAAAGTLAAYNSDTVRENAAATNFDPAAFPAGTDTIYITAPAHRQALCAPLVVGLLEQIRYAAYAHAATPASAGMPPVLFCLDELANIAPIHDLPALVSEAGGQKLQILACLQDLSQARKRWGDSTADGLLTLFQTKLILKGIADPKTLEAISLVLGEYDRRMATDTEGRTDSHEIFTPYTYSESVTHSTQRHRVLTPGEIARPPHGRALLLQGVDWQLIRTTAWYKTAPWRELAATSRGVVMDVPTTRQTGQHAATAA